MLFYFSRVYIIKIDSKKLYNFNLFLTITSKPEIINKTENRNKNIKFPEILANLKYKKQH